MVSNSSVLVVLLYGTHVSSFPQGKKVILRIVQKGRASFCLRQTAVAHTAVAILSSSHCALVLNCLCDILPLYI